MYDYSQDDDYRQKGYGYTNGYRDGYRDGMKDARNEVKPSLNWVSYPGVLLKDDGYKVRKIVKETLKVVKLNDFPIWLETVVPKFDKSPLDMIQSGEYDKLLEYVKSLDS